MMMSDAVHSRHGRSSYRHSEQTNKTCASPPMDSRRLSRGGGGGGGGGGAHDDGAPASGWSRPASRGSSGHTPGGSRDSSQEKAASSSARRAVAGGSTPSRTRSVPPADKIEDWDRRRMYESQHPYSHHRSHSVTYKGEDFRSYEIPSASTASAAAVGPSFIDPLLLQRQREENAALAAHAAAAAAAHARFDAIRGRSNTWHLPHGSDNHPLRQHHLHLQQQQQHLQHHLSTNIYPDHTQPFQDNARSQSGFYEPFSTHIPRGNEAASMVPNFAFNPIPFGSVSHRPQPTEEVHPVIPHDVLRANSFSLDAHAPTGMRGVDPGFCDAGNVSFHSLHRPENLSHFGPQRLPHPSETSKDPYDARSHAGGGVGDRLASGLGQVGVPYRAGYGTVPNHFSINGTEAGDVGINGIATFHPDIRAHPHVHSTDFLGNVLDNPNPDMTPYPPHPYAACPAPSAAEPAPAANRRTHSGQHNYPYHNPYHTVRDVRDLQKREIYQSFDPRASAFAPAAYHAPVFPDAPHRSAAPALHLPYNPGGALNMGPASCHKNYAQVAAPANPPSSDHHKRRRRRKSADPSPASQERSASACDGCLATTKPPTDTAVSRSRAKDAGGHEALAAATTASRPVSRDSASTAASRLRHYSAASGLEAQRQSRASLISVGREDEAGPKVGDQGNQGTIVRLHRNSPRGSILRHSDQSAAGSLPPMAASSAGRDGLSSDYEDPYATRKEILAAAEFKQRTEAALRSLPPTPSRTRYASGGASHEHSARGSPSLDHDLKSRDVMNTSLEPVVWNDINSRRQSNVDADGFKDLSSSLPSSSDAKLPSTSDALGFPLSTHGLNSSQALTSAAFNATAVSASYHLQPHHHRPAFDDRPPDVHPTSSSIFDPTPPLLRPRPMPFVAAAPPSLRHSEASSMAPEAASSAVAAADEQRGPYYYRSASSSNFPPPPIGLFSEDEGASSSSPGSHAKHNESIYSAPPDLYSKTAKTSADYWDIDDEVMLAELNEANDVVEMNLDEVIIDDEVESTAIFDLEEEERAALCTCGVASLTVGDEQRSNVDNRKRSCEHRPEAGDKKILGTDGGRSAQRPEPSTLPRSTSASISSGGSSDVDPDSPDDDARVGLDSGRRPTNASKDESSSSSEELPVVAVAGAVGGALSPGDGLPGSLSRSSSICSETGEKKRRKDRQGVLTMISAASSAAARPSAFSIVASTSAGAATPESISGAGSRSGPGSAGSRLFQHRPEGRPPPPPSLVRHSGVGVSLGAAAERSVAAAAAAAAAVKSPTSAEQSSIKTFHASIQETPTSALSPPPALPLSLVRDHSKELKQQASIFSASNQLFQTHTNSSLSAGISYAAVAGSSPNRLPTHEAKPEIKSDVAVRAHPAPLSASTPLSPTDAHRHRLIDLDSAANHNPSPEDFPPPPLPFSAQIAAPATAAAAAKTAPFSTPSSIAAGTTTPGISTADAAVLSVGGVGGHAARLRYAPLPSGGVGASIDNSPPPPPLPRQPRQHRGSHSSPSPHSTSSSPAAEGVAVRSFRAGAPSYHVTTSSSLSPSPASTPSSTPSATPTARGYGPGARPRGYSLLPQHSPSGGKTGVHGSSSHRTKRKKERIRSSHFSDSSMGKNGAGVDTGVASGAGNGDVGGARSNVVPSRSDVDGSVSESRSHRHQRHSSYRHSAPDLQNHAPQSGEHPSSSISRRPIGAASNVTPADSESPLTPYSSASKPGPALLQSMQQGLSQQQQNYDSGGFLNSADWPMGAAASHHRHRRSSRSSIDAGKSSSGAEALSPPRGSAPLQHPRMTASPRRSGRSGRGREDGDSGSGSGESPASLV